ncbi:MAG: DNA polymerase III subunit beta [Oscillospiraceae bacterium]|nr:DNA polymerase III subunit beta [Oscillospiraceae bacterium]
MKFLCDKDTLVSAATTAARATAPRSPVPALEGLLIEATERGFVRVTGYDLKTGIVSEREARVSESGAVILNARLFGDIIRRLPGDEVSVSVSAGTRVKIESGVASYNLIGSLAEDYPALPGTEGQTTMKISAPLLRDMLTRTLFAVATDETKPLYMGAMFETEKTTLTIVASDGFHLAMRREELSSETESNSFVVPGSALSEVEKILAQASPEDETEIIVGEKHVTFKNGETLLISRRLVGDYVNYRTAVPATSKYEITVSRREVCDAVERVALIINDKARSPVRCVFGDGTLFLTVNSAIGNASDECAIDGDGEKLEIGFSNRYLVETLKVAPSDTLKLALTAPNKICIITSGEKEDDSFLYLIMPVRLGQIEQREGSGDD